MHWIPHGDATHRPTQAHVALVSTYYFCDAIFMCDAYDYSPFARPPPLSLSSENISNIQYHPFAATNIYTEGNLYIYLERK